jgi:hypothetical protein
MMNPTGNIFFKQFHWKRQGIKKQNDVLQLIFVGAVTL